MVFSSPLEVVPPKKYAFLMEQSANIPSNLFERQKELIKESKVKMMGK
jgi:hypothetical protein